MRVDGRQLDEKRNVIIKTNYSDYAEGSVLINFGNTKVLCNASIENKVPQWMASAKVPGGWITAEYNMLPRATLQRTPRETIRLSGRTREISRLIGRSLRASVQIEELGQRTCIIDCDVLQADGGTRTAAITGGYVALVLGLKDLIKEDQLPPTILRNQIAAISAGIVAGTPMLDLDYQEDSTASVDANIVMNSEGNFIEVQSTAERKSYSRKSLDDLLDLAHKGILELFQLQASLLNG